MILPALTEATSPLFRPDQVLAVPTAGSRDAGGVPRPDDDVILLDEHVERLDLIADRARICSSIQAYITSARRAYEIADHFRARGSHVAMGGLHVTSMPDEAHAHADTVFLGPGEDTWPRVPHRLAPRRSTDSLHLNRANAGGLPPIRRDLIKRHLYLVPNSIVVSRGCPHHATSATRMRSSPAGSRSTPRRSTRRWPRSTGYLGGTCTSSTITCSATGGLPRRCSPAWQGWAACGRRHARWTRF